jgi:hypothetical protein
MIKIDKDIPPPISGTTIALALSQLKVNESFFLAGYNASIKNTAHMQIRKHSKGEKKFMTRSQDGGLRVWRLT